MLVIYSEKHKRHRPLFEVEDGRLAGAAELPARAQAIASALAKSKACIFCKPEQFPEDIFNQVHRQDYIAFLKSLSSKRHGYPSVFNYSSFVCRPVKYTAQKGYYCFDTYTPLHRNLWSVARESAFCALTGASWLQKGEKVVYSLCRPPGHHAMSFQAGGYCYLNNAALAASYLLNNGAERIAVLDIDYHHGNGTQQIFYQSSRVLTVSIHADPARKFPYFSGFVCEKGKGRGLGFNHNFPLSIGTSDHRYLLVLKKAIGVIRRFNPDFLIVSVGFDTYRKDPLGDFQITLSGFDVIGQLISQMPYPTLLVQEGGYHVGNLGKCAFSFLKSFLKKERR